MTAPDAVRLCGIGKRFGSVQALRGADLSVAPGEVHALLGENGAGKTTLMHVLFGLVPPDDGSIEIGGVPARIRSPRDAMARGIGMVHQHFTQVPSLTVAEHMWLGRPGLRYRRSAALESARRASAATGLALDPDARAGDLPVGLMQRLEILKAVARDDLRVLVLDEPTAALTPAEADDLFVALRSLASRGVALILITHKLREVLAVAQRVTVLRQGAVVLAGNVAEHTAESLAAAMIGPDAGRTQAAAGGERPARNGEAGTVAAADGLTVIEARSGMAKVVGATFAVRAGELVGIAAVEGNGQRELLRAVAGLMPHTGALTVHGAVGFVPEDRQTEGLVLEMSLAENLALGEPGRWWLDRDRMAREAQAAIEAFGIRAPATDAPVRGLSGGNLQKVVLARALARRPALLVAENPTRGLDVHATVEVHERLRAAARGGAGVLFHSSDLDEVLELADRVAVMSAGRWRWMEAPDRSRAAVGAAMLGAA